MLMATSCLPTGSAGAAARSLDGTTKAGQAVTQFAAQAGLQQSLLSWCIVDEDDDAVIGQSAADMANAGPEAKARERASHIKANRRRMVSQLVRARLTDNYTTTHQAH